MKRFLSILPLCASLLALSCTAPSAKTTIEFWTLQLSPTFNEYFNSLIAAYEKEHPEVHIRWVDVPYDAAIQKLLSSAVAGNAPDVVNLSADFLAKFNGMNAFADLSAAVSKSGQHFLPNALDLCSFNGKLVALPWYLNTYVVLYNKELIRTAGFSEKEIPATFKELIPFIREYKRRTGKFAFFWNIGKDSYLPMMLGSENIPMTDASMTKAVFNSPEGDSTIAEWVRLYKEGCLQSESVIKPGSTIVEAYQSGQVAMIFTGPVFLKRIKSNAPSIYERTGVAPAVVGKSGKHELAAMSLSVLSSSSHQTEASDFALFVTNAANQLAFSKLTTTFPSVTEALRDSFFSSDDGSVTSKARRMGAEQLPNAGRLRTYLLHPNFDRLRDAYDEAIQRACLKDVPVRGSLDKAADEWNTILNER
ncbi:MAG: ABC transporter substrate-binding protein [Bacteroidota bacterium]